MDLSGQIEQLANEHLVDTGGPPDQLLRRLGAKLRRQRRAVRHLQDKIAGVSEKLQSSACAPVDTLAEQDGPATCAPTENGVAPEGYR
jgi:hypothetical protein